MNDKSWNNLLKRAAKEGREAGTHTAEWYAQMPNVDRVRRQETAQENARRILRGIEDGDPEILDSLPWLDLSGQWADGATCEDVLNACDAPDDLTDEEVQEVISAYEDAYKQAVEDAVAEACREVLEG